MQIGVTGHQERPGIDWSWVEAVLQEEIAGLVGAGKALSSLAKGSDQIFANVALSLGIPVVAIIPSSDYERHFSGRSRVEYEELLKRCETVNLNWRGDEEQGFFEAGRYVVDHCDILFAIWDGRKAAGFGGTADVVEYARQVRKSIVHMNPISREIART